MNLLGIDFGTTKTLAARWDERSKSPRTIRLARNGDAIPTTIYVDKNGVFSFGEDADDMRSSDYAGWKGRIKRDLGREATVVLQGQSYRVVDLIARFLEDVRQRVENEVFHGSVDYVVVTVPALYGPAEREELKRAIMQAGFKEDRTDLLEEPVAAGCAFLLDKTGTELGNHVLVFDWGGGTLDLALVEHREGEFHLRPEWISGDKRLGGEDIDESVVEEVDSICSASVGTIDSQPDDRRLHIRRNLREGKELLSRREEHKFHLPFDPPRAFAWKREEFEHFTAATVDQAIRCLDDHLKKIRNSGLQVEQVLLVGGSSEIPSVRRRIEQELGLKAIRWEHSQTAVALGAAVEAKNRIGLLGEESQSATSTNTKPEKRQRPPQVPAAFAKERIERATGAKSSVETSPTNTTPEKRQKPPQVPAAFAKERIERATGTQSSVETSPTSTRPAESVGIKSSSSSEASSGRGISGAAKPQEEVVIKSSTGAISSLLESSLVSMGAAAVFFGFILPFLRGCAG